MSGELTFGLYNYLDSADIYTDSETATLPVNNLKNRVLGKKFRSNPIDNNDVTKTRIYVDLKDTKEAGLIGFGNIDTDRIATFDILAAKFARWSGLTSAAASSGVNTLSITGTKNAWVKQGDRVRIDSVVYKVDAALFIGENYLKYSNDLSVAAWTKVNVTVSNDGTLGPNGETAWKITESTATGGHYVEQRPTVDATNKVWQYNLKLKPNEVDNVYVHIFDWTYSTNSINLKIDLLNFEIDSVGESNGTVDTDASYVKELDDGWVKIVLIGTPSTSAGTQLSCRVAFVNEGNTTLTYAGDGVRSLYIAEPLCIDNGTEEKYIRNSAGTTYSDYTHTLTLSSPLTTSIEDGTSVTCITGDFEEETLWDSKDLDFPYGIAFWQRAVDSLTRKWESSDWWFGQLTDDQAELFGQNSWYFPSSILFAQYYRIDIDNSLSTTSYFSLGRLYLGSKEQIPYNFEYGSNEGTVDPSPTERTLGGVKISDIRSRIRVGSYNIIDVPDVWRPVFKDIQNRLGRSRQFVIIPRPDKPLEVAYSGMFVTQANDSSLVFEHPNISSIQISVEEDK